MQPDNAFNDFSRYSSPTEWMTLEQRRLIARLVMMYRIQYRLIDVTSDYITKSHSLRGHDVTLQQIRTRVKPYEATFSHVTMESPPCLNRYSTAPNQDVFKGRVLEALQA